jgi:metal-responsive CopG/Arc/MetJ family transcriptional regulator
LIFEFFIASFINYFVLLCLMESITIKVEDEMAQKIEAAMRPYYSTKTEFIREAIRDKLIELEKESIIAHFEKYFGKAKNKVSDAELRRIREEVGRKYASQFGIKLK